MPPPCRLLCHGTPHNKLDTNFRPIQKQRSIPSALRPFSQTTLARFSLSAVQKSSPFRLSSDKNTPFPFPEEDPYSQYPPKRQWPPDMTKLSQKHQFRLERKYRRRAALKYARPQFIKAVTLAQWVIIGCESMRKLLASLRILGRAYVLTWLCLVVAIYAVLFMDWDTKDTPFDGVSSWRIFYPIA